MAKHKEKYKKLNISIWGIVQGVGFRPYVKRLADKHGLYGRVLNNNGCVQIEVVGKKPLLEIFLDELVKNKPSIANIISMDSTYIEVDYDFNSFYIDQSNNLKNGFVFPPQDISICEDCEKELFDNENPRYLHPFISCTLCGPRYSIIEKLPYDRIATSMKGFPLCSFCEGEYSRADNRRQHAQTIACNNCGPVLSYHSRVLENGTLTKVIEELKNGGIVAIKGIGGYHLACSPFNDTAVANLRKLKKRYKKPFAVMFKNISAIKQLCEISDIEETQLLTHKKPIVPVKIKREIDISRFVTGDACSLGVFLPYTPLHHLILNETVALVMTSANTSDLPLIYKDKAMLEFFNQEKLINGVLSHNREIVRRVDDSVVSCFDNNVQIIRRARGYVPLPVEILNKSERAILACGGQQKNTFCIARGQFAYPSTHIGDLDDENTYNFYIKTIDDMKNLIKITPEFVCCDLHPEYRSTIYAKSLGLPLMQVQHHFAHIVSVMAEHKLTETVIGIAFDGTGYGIDGTLWGGEFLIASPIGFERVAHLKPFALQGGDGSVSDAWKTAICLLYSNGLESEITDDRFKIIKPAILNKINVMQTSSMGRLFDAVSSLLNICHIASFEGDCAIQLENEAKNNSQKCESYDYEITTQDDKMLIDIKKCLVGIYADIKAGYEKSYIAYRFHLTVIDFTVAVCKILREKYNINFVALSGGVFQNKIIISNLLKRLKQESFVTYINEQVPTNDGGISLGQAYLAQFKI